MEKRGRIYFSSKTKRQKSPNQALEWTAGSGRWLTVTFLAAATQLGRYVLKNRERMMLLSSSLTISDNLRSSCLASINSAASLAISSLVAASGFIDSIGIRSGQGKDIRTST
jgi:hypothetical protein